MATELRERYCSRALLQPQVAQLGGEQQAWQEVAQQAWREVVQAWRLAWLQVLLAWLPVPLV